MSRLCFSRNCAASSRVRRGFWADPVSAASACCASTDLLSQPRAILLLSLRRCRQQGQILLCCGTLPVYRANKNLANKNKVQADSNIPSQKRFGVDRLTYNSADSRGCNDFCQRGSAQFVRLRRSGALGVDSDCCFLCRARPCGTCNRRTSRPGSPGLAE